ncbi:MAG: hypothetical protein GY838_17630 [bacterium]|nr:hypothetical protein [bacterium]
MNRTRTIFVSLVILLVSMTMVLSVATAAPVPPDIGSDLQGDLPLADGIYTTDGGAGPTPPDGEGDPGDDGDGFGFDGGRDVLIPFGADADASPSLTWSQVLYLLTFETIQIMVMP